MNPELFAQAKELFIELVDKSPPERESQLKSLRQTKPELAKEVQDLLAKHFSRTIMMPTGKMAKTTVQSRTFPTLGLKKISSNLVGGALPMASALGAALFLMGVSWYLQTELIQRTRVEYEAVLKSMTEQKSALMHQWIRGHELRMQDWGRQRELQELVVQLDAKVHDPTLVDKAGVENLAISEEQPKIKSVLERLFSQPLRIESDGKLKSKERDESKTETESREFRYAIWNRSLNLLADWQYTDPRAELGGIVTPIGASVLSRVFDSRTTSIELPRPSADSISKDYPMESTDQYVMFFVPIFLPENSDQVVAVMMIRCEAFMDELQSLLSMTVLPESNCYLLDDRGAIATQGRDVDLLASQPWFSENKKVRGAIVFEARDPGGNLLAGFEPKGSVNEWAWTKPGKTVSQPSNGSDVFGYRDYRGQEVVGAWRWMDTLQRLLVLEIPKERAFKTQAFIHRAFRFIYGVPIFISLVLAALSLRRAFSTMDLRNKSLGAYKLGEKIGEGGLGIVYQAEHQMLGRTAAIKLIKEPLANSSSLKRFEREVRMAAMLNHPNTVSIYDFGVSKDGLLYCAMEFVDGVNLANFIAYEPKLPIDRCIWILCQIGGAVEEAHCAGLIHRDIKPQNIMICQKGQLADLIKVVDFGLAKTMVDDVTRDVTATRVLIGTPGFIAPERLETPWIADPRIDIFAFGVLGIYLLTGKVPLLGVTTDSLLQTLQLGRFSELCNDLTFHSLVSLLAKCISPDPGDRPSSMSEVVEKLESIAAYFPWNEDMAEKWWRANEADLIAFARTKD